MDIRKLDLLNGTNKVVTSAKPGDYAVGNGGDELIPSILEDVVTLPYWSPKFQAWEPFLTTYLRSGVRTLAQQWSKKLVAKIEELGPTQGRYSRIYAEILRYNRSSGTEILADFSWADIMEFVEWIPTLINNQKAIYKVIVDPAVTRSYLSQMLQSNKDDKGLSPYLAQAVYLYRHSVFANADELFADLVEEMNKQLNIYADEFSAEFDSVASFCNSANNPVYGWYTDKVKNIISNAWRTGCNKSGTRRVISNNDVFSMPVWLSEQLTSYIETLPPVVDLEVNQQFVFDAIQCALETTATPVDKVSLYAYCMPRDRVKKMFENLSDFYWEVREDRLIPTMVARVVSQYQSDTAKNSVDPVTYKRELVARGFPVEECD